MNNQKLMFFVVAVIFLAIGFGGGVVYQKNQKVTNPSDRQFARQNGNQARRPGGGRVVGQIIGVDSKSITVKMSDNSSKVVLLSDKTIINKAATGTLSDLVSGVEVAVFGSDNSDGSVTAQSVQLNPQFGRPETTPTPSR